MRAKLLLAAWLCLAAILPALADDRVNDLDIRVTLADDGSAHIREVWDMTLSRGTEVYLGRENLGDMEIRNLTVSDDEGKRYITESDWDTDRDIDEKAGRCGLNYTRDGVEICWGIGDYGRHVWTVDYTLTNLVKSLQDYDMIHYEFVTENDFKTDHAKVTIEKPGFVMDSLTLIWGFGFGGRIWQEDGRVVTESDETLRPGDEVIVLMRFDKGVFDSPSVQDRPFREVLDMALEGAGDTERPKSRFERIIGEIFMMLQALFFALLPFAAAFIAVIAGMRNQRRAFGNVRMRDIPWSREIPYGNSLLMNHYVLSTVPGFKLKKQSVASAMILHMLQEGCLQAVSTPDGKVDLHFNPGADFSRISASEKDLWDMMLEAAGDNAVLEEKEFSRWARRHSSRLVEWTSGVRDAGLEALRRGAYYQGSRYTDSGCAENRKIVGFKKFLEDTTLIKERSTPEVALWREYLIFAALVGIADQVAKELKDINPVMFEQLYSAPYPDMYNIIRMTNAYSNVFSTYGVPRGSSGSGFNFGGGGGFTSFGGGGGFSGGGHSGVR